MYKLVLILLFTFFAHISTSYSQDTIPTQINDSIIQPVQAVNDSVSLHKARRSTTVTINDSTQIIYERPRGFDFLTNIPRDFGEFGKRAVKKKGLITIGALAASTALLMAVDKPAMDGVQQFGRWSGISGEREFASAIAFKVGNVKVNFLDLPQNFNSTLYFIGEGWPTIAFTAGLLTKGFITNDNRAILTASQVLEGYLVMGVTVQLIKRTTGRQSPFRAEGTANWDFFPSPSHYQSNVSNHDAFPSGHLATAMASVTIYAENYPEKKWIRPVGYSFIGLIGLSMMNNGVHWVSDYPLALAIGYTYGKIVTSRGKTILFSKKKGHEDNKGVLTCAPVMLNRNNVGMSIRLTL